MDKKLDTSRQYHPMTNKEEIYNQIRSQLFTEILKDGFKKDMDETIELFQWRGKTETGWGMSISIKFEPSKELVKRVRTLHARGLGN